MVAEEEGREEVFHDEKPFEVPELEELDENYVDVGMPTAASTCAAVFTPQSLISENFRLMKEIERLNEELLMARKVIAECDAYANLQNEELVEARALVEGIINAAKMLPRN